MAGSICTSCGYANITGTVFCELCGATLELAAIGAAAISEQEDEATESGSRTTVKDEGLEPTGIPSTNAFLTTESGRHLDIPEQDVVIMGREDIRSGTRPDLDFSVDGASASGVSRRHCRILRLEDGWAIEDLMSTNHTTVNGQVLTANNPTALKDGDEIRLGKLQIQFHVRA